MTVPRTTTILDDLDAALHGDLGLNRVDRLERFTGPGSDARYLRAPRLTVALHFDIEPAFLVFDPLLGTLGVVEMMLPSADPKADKISEQLRRSIDRATYLRHLLLRDRNLGQRRPLSVELVLLTADHTPEERQVFADVSAAIRDALHNSGSPFHIGLGVLCHGGPDVRFERRLRRAFPWLLTATQRWLESPRAAAVEHSAGPVRTLRSLVLSDYRLPGKRTMALADARVHLVHGANGSGKSSIAEALELSTTGKIERLALAGEQRYDQVIENVHNGAKASVQLGWTVAGSKELVLDDPQDVVASGVSRPLDGELEASSFRLDQTLMDRLVGKYPHERARIFLRAFFPEAVASLAAYEQATQAHDANLAKLDRVVERLTAARNALLDLRDWKSGASTHTVDAFPAVLNRWLEQTALIDLLQRARSVHETLGAARGAGWTAVERMNSALAAFDGQLDVGQLVQLEAEARGSGDALQHQLASFTTSSQTIAPTAHGTASVTPLFVEALNAVSSFLFSATDLASFGLFGHKLAAVINAGGAPTYGPTVIGADKWSEPIIKDIDSLIAACNTLRVDDSVAAPWPGKSPCTEYDEALQSHALRLQTGKDITEGFVDKLRPNSVAEGEFDGSLIAALNETMALFTPARWAYVDIELPPNLQGGKLGLPIQLGSGARDVRAELHLNTAELNLFTVALFLLCSGRVRKPLNLLVLDDPLQNMDELTSTALARGVAKLVRLWAKLGRKEELLFLLHGQDDLGRFRAEVAAAVYHLPWLSPSHISTPLDVTADAKDGNALEVQSIEGIALRLNELPAGVT